MSAGAATTPTVMWDRLWMFPRLPKAKYALTFDDGAARLYDPAKYLWRNGIKGTFYIIPSLLGTATYLTTNQIADMRDMGHIIANHGWLSTNLLTSGTTNTFVADVAAGARWLSAHGYGDGARLFAWPGGTSSSTWPAVRSVLGIWADQVRLTQTSLTGWTHDQLTGYFPWYPIHDGFYYATAADNGLNCGVELTNAIKWGMVAVTYWHTPDASFTNHVWDLLSCRSNNLVDIVTMADLMHLDEPIIPTNSVGAYGSLMMNATNIVVCAGAAAVYTNISGTGFTTIVTNGFYGATAGTHAALTNLVSGWYKVVIAASYMGANGGAYESEVFTNSVSCDLISFKDTFDTPARLRNGSSVGIIYLPAGTRVSFKIQDGGTGSSIAVHRASLTVGTP